MVSGLMSVTDAAAVVKAAAMAAAAALEAAAATPHRGSGTGALPSLAPKPAALATARKPSPGGGAGPAVSELQDLDELALMVSCGMCVGGVLFAKTVSASRFVCAVTPVLRPLSVTPTAPVLSRKILPPSCPARCLQLDLAQLQHTLLAALQPFLHDALLRFRRPPSFAERGADITAAKGDQVPDSAAGVAPPDESAAAGSNHQQQQHVGGREDGGCGGGWWVPQDEAEEEDEEVLGDLNVLAALAPADLTTWCLKLLLKLQWALYCRAQVRKRAAHAT